MAINKLEQFIREQLDSKSLTKSDQAFLEEELSRAQERILSPEFLEAEWERQVKRYTEHEFHKHPRFKMPRGKFKDSMPRFRPQPKEYRGTVGIPILSMGRKIPAPDQFRLLGVDYLLEGLPVGDWGEDPFGYQTPDVPYVVYSDDGINNLGIKVADVRRKSISELLRGGTEYDSAGLYNARPEILNDRFLDFPGTSVGSGRAPCLRLWDDRPKLRYAYVPMRVPSLVRFFAGEKLVLDSWILGTFWFFDS